MHHSHTWHHDSFPYTFKGLFLKTIMLKFLILKTFASQMDESKNPPPLTLAQALIVALETCRE